MLVRLQIVKRTAKLAAMALVLANLVMPGQSLAANATPRDNDANAIMWGGCYSKSECLDKISHGDGHHSASNLQQIYYHEGRGITEANFNSSATKDGTVTKDGKVMVDGKVVATGAESIGRDYMAGSHQDGSVYERPTSVSFRSDSIPAFVNMEGGTFHYAVLKSCGNAVRAKAVPTPTPTPKPTPTPISFACTELIPSQPDKFNHPTKFRFTMAKPHTTGNVQVTGYRFSFKPSAPVVDTSASTPYIERDVAAGSSLTVYGQVKTTAGITAISNDCSATVNVNQPSPSPTPTPTATPTPTGHVLGVSLPATGPETALGGVAGLSAIGVASRYYLRSRKSLLDSLRRKR